MQDSEGAAAGDGKRPWLDARVAGWAFYDVASSAYVAIVPMLFPLLFASVILDAAPGADARFALLGATALLAAGIVTPLVGAIADRGRLLPWLVGATAICCVATALMPGLRPGDVVLASMAFVLAQSGYTVAMALYESFLPRLATRGTFARVSAFGWACGLSGGILALVVALVFVRGRPEAEGLSIALGIAAAGFALLALPALLVLARSVPTPRNAAPHSLRTAWQSVVDDLRGWRSHRNSAKFLLAYLLINDASVTVVLVVTLYFRTTFGLSLEGLVKLLLLYHVIAAPATLAWGVVADRIGLARAIHLNLVVWAFGIVLMVYARGEWAPWLITCTFGIVIASTNALCRALYARLVPVDRSAQFFGFNAVVGRMSAAAGPLVYAAISTATGSPDAALLSLLAFIVAGSLVLAGVDTTPVVSSSGPVRETGR